MPPRIHGKNRALSRVPSYSRQLTHAFALQNTLRTAAHLTAPSAVHLTICFLPDSHHRRLSVKASLPLSPHQRFILLNYIGIISPQYVFVNKIFNIFLLQTPKAIKKSGFYLLKSCLRSLSIRISRSSLSCAHLYSSYEISSEDSRFFLYLS